MQKELMEKSLEFCAHIPHLMGLEAHVLDKEKLDAFCGDCPRNGFCAGCTYQNKEEMKPHIYGLHEAYRWQGKYMYYCPIGLMFGAFALLDGQGELAGGLIVGPLVVDDVADTLLDCPCPELEEAIRALPNFTKADAAHLLEGLALVAEGFSGSRWSNAKADRYFDQQEYLNAIYEVKDRFKQTENPNYPVELESQLVQHILNGEKNEAQDILNILLGYIYYLCEFDIRVIRARMMELLAVLSRTAIRAGVDVGEIFGFSTPYIWKIETFESVEEISAWLSGIVHRFVDAVFDFRKIKHSDMVYRVMEYVRQHYRQKLNLDELAKAVCFSSSYLSSVFKKETGVSISAYVNRVRVENSKRLLKDSSLGLSYIANECGFDDQSYFTKVFKAQEGVSPKKYRDMYGTEAVPG